LRRSLRLALHRRRGSFNRRGFQNNAWGCNWGFLYCLFGLTDRCGGSCRRRNNGGWRRCGSGHLGGHGGCNGRGSNRLCHGRLFDRPSLFFSRDGRRDCDNGRLHHNRRWWRGNHHDWARRGTRTHRRLGNHCAGWRTGCNRGRCRGSHNNGRRGARLRDNPARLGAGRRCGGWGGHNADLGRRGRCHWRLRAHRHMRVPRFLLFLLLVGENRFQHVAGLGDMRQIDLGLDSLCRTRRSRAALAAAACSALKLRTDLVRLVVLQ